MPARLPVWLAASSLLLLTSCGKSDQQEQADSSVLAIADPVSENDKPDTDTDKGAAQQQAIDKLDGEAFEDVGDTSLCTDDCSGHNAGFEWAKKHEIVDAGNCGGNSQSFIEGCQAYAQAVEDQSEDE